MVSHPPLVDLGTLSKELEGLREEIAQSETEVRVRRDLLREKFRRIQERLAQAAREVADDLAQLESRTTGARPSVARAGEAIRGVRKLTDRIALIIDTQPDHAWTRAELTEHGVGGSTPSVLTSTLNRLVTDGRVQRASRGRYRSMFLRMSSGEG